MPGTRATLDPEWLLLTAACSPNLNDDKLVSLLKAPVCWKRLFEMADQHGAQPLLHQTLSSAHIVSQSLVPADEMAALAQSYQANLHKALLLSRELLRIVDALYAASIEFLPYKGLALAELAYGDIALRPAGDIDLLIHPQDLARTRSALRPLGYVPHQPLSEAEERAYLKSGYECVFDGVAGRNLVEVKWAIQPRFYSVNFDIDGLFRRAASVNVAGHSMRTLSPEDSILVLSVHAAKHAWARLVWLCDIARIMALANLDWVWIQSQAKDLGIARIVRITMLLIQRLLNAEIPESAAVLFPQDPEAFAIADEIEAQLASGVAYNVESAAYFRLMMRVRERPVDRLRFVTRLALTPGPSEWDTIHLPDPLFPLYRLVRLSRLAMRFLRP
jgi:hypothetical protein